MNFRNVKVLGVTSILALVASCSNPSNFEVPTLVVEDETSTSVFGGKKLTQATPEYIFGITNARGGHCHGTRISNTYILSAAHCFRGNKDDLNTTLFRLNGSGKVIQYKNAVLDVAIHPKFQEKDQRIRHRQANRKDNLYAPWQSINNYDLALIKVRPEQLPSNANNPVNYQLSFKDPMRFATMNNITSAFMYSFMNHRALEGRPNFGFESRRIDIDLASSMTSDVGDLWFEDRTLRISICRGDSGAGVFMRHPSDPKTIYLIGLVANGPGVKHEFDQCTALSTLANVPKSIDWIRSTLSK